MNEKNPSHAMAKAVGLLALLGMCALLDSDDAQGVGIAQVMKAKSLPEATVQVIDPETGSSTGGSGGDVRLAPGDIILFRFAFTPVPDKANRGMQSYLTEYIPPNTEVVGVRIIDEQGRTIKPRLPGLAIEHCSGGNSCNTFNSLPCASGTCSFPSGSVAQVHADTGIFFTTDARLARVPSNAFITMDNGVLMNPIPSGISPDLLPLLDRDDPSITQHFAHNEWDWDQVLAYGIRNSQGNPSGTGAGGNTPHLYGSPVAGPETHYLYEATDVTGLGNIQFNNVVGPWRRIHYPGSKIGFGNPYTGGGAVSTRMIRDPVGAEVGFDVTPANPIVNATALRYALGESRTGRPMFVELALRVTAVPIDPGFGSAGENMNCGESFGSGLAVRGNNSDGNNHPWITYIASPSCVYLKLLFDLNADKELAVGENIDYTLEGKNLSIFAETSAVVTMQFQSNRTAYVAGSASPPPDSPTPVPCPTNTSKDCLFWTLGTLQPSEEYTITATFTAGGGGRTSGVVEAIYTSDQLPDGFITRDITVITGIALPDVELAPEFEPTVTPAIPGTTTRLIGTISNEGTNSFTYSRLVAHLPAGWTSAGPLVIGGTSYACSANCTTNRPSYTINSSFAVGDTRALRLSISVPAGAATGLHSIDVQVFGGQSGFGGDFETYFPEIATIPVGAVRTARPVITCPIGSTAPAITGTSEPGADIRALFSLMERGSGLADPAGQWTVNDYGAFGELYGGLEVRATAWVPGKLTSELSEPCEVSHVRACSDGIDNDGDGLIDFPADPGCDSPSDNDESNVLAQCSDGIDNDGNGRTDWPEDLSCDGPDDDTENGVPACSDGIDNDGDGLTDYPADPDCASPAGISEAALPRCQDRIDNDGDGFIDFDGLGTVAAADPGCHSAFDDSEEDLGYTPLDVKARLLIVFDTSGSMNWNTCTSDFTGGDGSVDFPGDDVVCAELPGWCTGSALQSCDNAMPDDSRLYKVKAGIADVIAAFGEVEYGLMRFHQRATTFGPPSFNASLSSGGWQGGGAAPCSGGFNAGDLLVSFSPDNQQTILDWIDGATNYAGTPPPGLDQELRGSGTTPLAGALGSALDYLDDVRAGDAKATCRPYRVILVTDGQETCGGDPAAAAQALYSAGIEVAVIGFATSDANIIDSLNAIAHAGSDPASPKDAIFVDDEASLSTAMAAIVTDSILVETCNSLDDDCDGFVDEGFDVGTTCDNGELGVCYQTGVTECTESGFDTRCNAPPGTANPPEVCNLLDDDCDGRIDEGLSCNCTTTESCNGLDDDCDGVIDEGPIPGEGMSCGIDIGACTPGVLVCVSNPGPPPSGSLECLGGTGPAPGDTCNGVDDDCDTLVDEDIGDECYSYPTGCTIGAGCEGQCQTGFIECVAGAPGACVGEVGPSPETCNYRDDDCDGAVDENWPEAGTTCSNGQVGVCEAFGVWECLPDGSGTYCTAPTIPPGTEVCNGLDDDCDGSVDEALGPPIGNACGGTGGCSVGTFQCVPDGMGGASIQCVGSTGGSPEVCNGIDDDCDTLIDEDIEGVGEPCTAPGYEQYGDTGKCEFGQIVCAPPAGLVCQGYIGPDPGETCDGIDNDCDGLVDNEAVCPSPEDICVAAQCASPCGPGEFPCPFGHYCETLPEGRYCLADPCASIQCPPGHVCHRDTAECVDLCAGVECQDGEICQNGLCFDCFVLGCDAGEICVSNDSGVGVCQPDPCVNANCDSGEFCRNGDCVPLTCNPACPQGQVCTDGQCQLDLCDGTSCSSGQICNPESGQCVRDQCEFITCPAGQACNPSTGMCIADPCAATVCPDGFVCEVTFNGTSQCRRNTTDEFVYTGGGGCCAAGGDDVPGNAVLLALLALFLGRRRGRSRKASLPS
jgi:hypothetical protein